LAQSNPLYAQAQAQREIKPSEPSLSVNNVKKVWGTAQPAEETKAVEIKPEEHYTGANNIAGSKTANKVEISVNKASKKEDKKKADKANALFAGISGV